MRQALSFAEDARRQEPSNPTAWAMEGIHDLILRDRGLAEVLPTLGVLSLYGAACLLVGTWLQRLDD